MCIGRPERFETLRPGFGDLPATLLLIFSSFRYVKFKDLLLSSCLGRRKAIEYANFAQELTVSVEEYSFSCPFALQHWAHRRYVL